MVLRRTVGTRSDRLARSVLALLVAVGLGLIGLPNGPLAGIGHAQALSPSIRFLNPDDDTSTELSDKDDDFDNAYHLVAWMNDSGIANPGVRFYYQVGNAQPVEIGAASLVGSDTWEKFWDIDAALDQKLPSPPTVTLIARLFSGQTERASDLQTVVINNDGTGTPPDAEETAETVEITTPANGASWPLFKTTGETRAGIIKASASSQTSYIVFKYSTSGPGNEPVWKTCEGAAANATPTQALTGVRCQLASGDNESNVRAVAAIPNSSNDLPSNVDDDSDAADAHRVTPRLLVPAKISIAPQSVTVARSNPPTNNNFVCSGIFTVTALTQADEPVPAANIDVHARGPNDSVKFDDNDGAGNSTDPSKPPNTGHAGNEATSDCESSAAPPPPGASQQGNHIQFDADIKHIESTNGTKDDGTFTFRMANPTSEAGNTQIVAWIDVTEDDLKCPGEARAFAAVGWGQTTPPSPTGDIPDDQPCPSPSPSPGASGSPTPTPSSSATPTATPSASPTVTPSPSPSLSPSTTPSPTPTATQSPTIGPTSSPSTGPETENHARDVDDFSFKHRRGKLRIKGTVDVHGNFGACGRNVPVRIEKRTGNGFETIKQVSSNGEGVFKARIKDRPGRYRVVAPRIDLNGGRDICGRAEATKRHKHK